MGQKQFHNVENKELRAILMKQDWVLSKGKYRMLKCKEFFTKIKKQSLKLKKLDFSANNGPEIPLDIMHIHFSSTLIFIDLSGNAINSLEKISFLDIKNLQVLVVEWNHIMSLGGFRKNSFKNLEQLKLSTSSQMIGHNYVVEYGNFERAQHKKMKVIELQTPSEIFLIRQTISDVINKVAKMQSQKFYLMGLGASHRMNRSKSHSFQAVQRKFDHRLYFTKNKNS